MFASHWQTSYRYYDGHIGIHSLQEMEHSTVRKYIETKIRISTKENKLHLILIFHYCSSNLLNFILFKILKLCNKIGDLFKKINVLHNELLLIHNI